MSYYYDTVIVAYISVHSYKVTRTMTLTLHVMEYNRMPDGTAENGRTAVSMHKIMFLIACYFVVIWFYELYVLDILGGLFAPKEL